MDALNLSSMGTSLQYDFGSGAEDALNSPKLSLIIFLLSCLQIMKGKQLYEIVAKSKQDRLKLSQVFKNVVW